MRSPADDTASQIAIRPAGSQARVVPGWGRHGAAAADRGAVEHAVEIICGGESIDANEAAKLGLAIDVDSEKLLPTAIDLVRQEQKSGDYRRDRQRWAQPLDITDTELYFLGATANAHIQQLTKGHYPAPIAALETMLEAARDDGSCRPPRG